MRKTLERNRRQENVYRSADNFDQRGLLQVQNSPALASPGEEQLRRSLRDGMALMGGGESTSSGWRGGGCGGSHRREPRLRFVQLTCRCAPVAVSRNRQRVGGANDRRAGIPDDSLASSLSTKPSFTFLSVTSLTVWT